MGGSGGAAESRRQAAETVSRSGLSRTCLTRASCRVRVVRNDTYRVGARLEGAPLRLGAGLSPRWCSMSALDGRSLRLPCRGRWQRSSQDFGESRILLSVADAPGKRSSKDLGDLKIPLWMGGSDGTAESRETGGRNTVSRSG